MVNGSTPPTAATTAWPSTACTASPPWLDLVGFIDIGGRAPRDIALTPDGAFLLAASQDDHFIRALRIDPSTGLAQAQGDPHPLASPACLCPLP
ncbi:3-carboxymuconate cyclase [Achromobacter sp. 2789STDY5608615]|uniref:beta-propeller fold lactonase family protein n=1 Tax=Achromobacter sp. 2789STDY5608615 TaxID=1806492 RepID=UPI0006C2B94C|nr:beta-propeller fold lactonase family protein [Achromobacter sp. 2789STDY5608615]CUK13477.1 3-carboxymuconate cyclase [Achromobacter sp. 2789STDY5608615]